MNINATTISRDTTNRFVFNLEIDNVKYTAIIYTNEKGKFIDDEISYQNGDELEFEGAEGEIREKIIDYLDKNWDTLVKS